MDNQKPPDALHLALHATPASEDPLRRRAGDLCPRCGQARLDYDGLLNLACPQCGPVAGGCFT